MVITCLIRDDTSSKLNLILTLIYFVLDVSMIVTTLFVKVIPFFNVFHSLYIDDFGSFRKLFRVRYVWAG